MYEFEAIIEKKRKEMFDIAGRYGFASEKTIRCSQELDRLLNALMQRRAT
ncbi:aspartyl-phosphate phosphatase Spo0E family protein [Guptibacillus algicola]|nr:aspartyl-phosphate phosphatase Spo0E family protein [Alkalihalobacillus algicola]MCA0987725.1 aspartyl-phosphate phosphatase Spo0E family protein [Alkalihalobacillus algicola]